MSRRLTPSLRLASLLVALPLALPPPGAAAGLDDLDWLAGCWQGEGGGGENQECWMAPGGGTMLGVSRVISEQGTMFEFLRIAEEGDGLVYLASPRGRPAVAFRLVESADGMAVFANPEHDFPQRITYRRDGEALSARVEALRDGEWRGFDIAWRRASGAWPACEDGADQVPAMQE